LPKIGFIDLGNLPSNPIDHNFSQFKVSSKHNLTEKKKRFLMVKNCYVKKNIISTTYLKKYLPEGTS